jgi:hypothetical protein
LPDEDASVSDPSPSERILSLAEQILSTIEQPKDHWEVAAHLEVSGIRDIDARQDFGCRDVFELARRIVALAGEIAVPSTQRPPRRPTLPWRFVKAYADGLLFSMPMVAQIFAMLLFGYSLWAWVGFSLREATAIGLGTVTSFIATGGFAQALSRRGYFYMQQKEDILAKRVSYRILLVGMLAVVAIGLLFFLGNLVFEFLPPDMEFLAQLYYFLLSVLWLSFSILYMLKRQLLFTGITVVSILAVHFVILFFRWEVIPAHSLGLGVAILLSLVSGWIILQRQAKHAGREYAGSELPRPSMLVYATGPYFWYGMLFFAFLFADRIVAWSADTGRGLLPYFIWFDSRYEMGMDWALFCFVLTVGVLEFTIQEFSERIIPAERMARADEVGHFNRRFTRFYYNHLALFLVVSLLTILGARMGVNLLRTSQVFPFVEGFFTPVAESVFWWAAIGYVFLVFGLFNSIFLFALSRPAFVLRSLTPALLLNLAVGFILSRAVSYELAVVGLTAGSFAFLIISSFYARRTFRRLDYYYYSAY